MRKIDKHWLQTEAMSFSLSQKYNVYIIPTFTNGVYRLGYLKDGIHRQGRKTYTPEEAEAKIHELYLEFYYQAKPYRRPKECKNRNNGVCLLRHLCKCL